MDAVRTTLDADQRTTSYHRAFKILREGMRALPQYQEAAIYGARLELKLRPSPN